MTVWLYTAITYSGTTETRTVAAPDGDAAKRLGRQSVEHNGHRVILHSVRRADA